MNKITKDISKYVLINILLLLLASLLIVFIILKYDKNKEDIISQINNRTDGLITTLQKEIEVSKKEEILENSVVIALVGEYSEQQVTKTTIQSKYYYEQLDDVSKDIYTSIENNLDKMKTGKYAIKLSDTVANIMNKEDGMDKINIAFQSAWDAIIMDRVDCFFIDVSKVVLSIESVTSNNNKKYTLTIKPKDVSYLEDSFINEQVVNMALTQVNNETDKIIASLKGNDYTKIKQVHNWLVDNISYGTNISGRNSYNIYGALINKSAVCEGYAEAFKYILDKIGITCILVGGIAKNSEGANENHEWNYVQLDGRWYGVDVTWDDPIIIGGGEITDSIKYKYFLKGSKIINKNHFSNPNISDGGMQFVYPALEEQDY